MAGPPALRRVLLLLLLTAGVLPARRARADEAAWQAESTREMAALLAQLADEADPRANPYLNAQRAALLREQIAHTPDQGRQVQLRVRLGRELLLAGDSLEAVRELQQVAETARQYPQLFNPVFRYLLRDELAVAYLRLGEQENCLQHHNPDMCLMPIRGGGVHTIQRGSRKAVETYTAILKDQPKNLGAMWLLNLAHMTLGQYPDGVPEQWRIPPRVFESDYPLPRFPDVAPALGIAAVGLSGGSAMEDFDGDGLLDVMASSWGQRDQLRFFRNNGDGTFTDRTAAAGLTGLTGGLNIIHADYDNDGRPDVLVLRGAWLGEQGLHPNSLLHNNGDGTFTDVTKAAGLLTFHPTQTAAWGDYDNDGDLDLYIGNETGSRTALFTGRDDVDTAAPGVHPCQLFRNNGDGTFTEAAAAAGVATVGFVKGVAWGDYDDDGRIDLYLSRLGEPNVLYRNVGPDDAGVWRFEDVTGDAGVAEPLFSFPTWFWDYDNDGDLDLFVAGYSVGSVGDVAAVYLDRPTKAERPRLYRNDGDGTFTNVTYGAHAATGLLAMGANFGDLDNDGWLDFYLGNGSPNLRMLLPNRMYRGTPDGVFQDVTTAGGFGHLQKGHGVAFGDLDNDGDQDLYAVIGGAYTGDVYPNALFLNPGFPHHWLTLRFEGHTANRMAEGARVAVRVATPDGERTIHRVVGTGGSFGSSSLQLEVGLGNATAVRSVTVRWPGPGTVQTFEDVPRDTIVLLREGEPAPTVVELPRIDLAGQVAGAVAHPGHAGM